VRHSAVLKDARLVFSADTSLAAGFPGLSIGLCGRRRPHDSRSPTPRNKDRFLGTPAWMPAHHSRAARIYNEIYMIRFFTAGESLGEALIALVSGLPAGVPVDLDFVNRELWRRQQGYGRGGRMKIETDQAHVLSGVRHGKTIGSPIAIELINRDWKNWQEKLPVETGDPAKHRAVTSPRPGHADLAGALKYNFPDARYVLERASARESAARVAAGAFAKLMLRELGIEVASHVVRVGRVDLDRDATWEEIVALGGKEEVVLSCVDAATEARMKEEVEAATRADDTVNGVFEVVAHGVPAGLGSYAN